MSRPPALAALALLAACVAALALLAAPATAQPTGRIEGVVRQGTAGAPAIDAVAVRLLTLGADGAASATRETTTRGGRFAFGVAADPALSYVVSTTHAGLAYLAPPVLLDAALPTAEVEIVVHETTREPPPLTIARTLVTVVALDRANARLELVREDELRHAGDRVYLGGADGVTLRLPLPDGAADAGGAGGEGEYRVEDGALALAAPLRPGAATLVTRYAVGYDRARDAHALRIAAPLPTARMEIDVPTRFADDIEPLAGSRRGGDRDDGGERIRRIALEGEARAGESAGVLLSGLSGRNAANPLAGGRGALAGLALAIAILGGGAALARAAGRRGAAA